MSKLWEYEKKMSIFFKFLDQNTPLRTSAARGELAARIVRKHTLVARAYFLRRGVKQPRKMCHRGNSKYRLCAFRQESRPR